MSNHIEDFVIKTYGRTRAHGLSTTQENNLQTLYPIYGITLPTEKIDPRQFFFRKFSQIAFEIGFGNGEHLIEQAKRHPNVGFIGCEPFENGVVSALCNVQKFQLINVRIYNGDARDLLGIFHDHTLNRVYILFPDPWRKHKHRKRRLVSTEFLSNLKMKIAPYTCIVIATDHEDYRNHIIDALKNANITFSEELMFQRPQCFVKTKYERKARTNGIPCAYFRGYV